jgi:hypothetical protein
MKSAYSVCFTTLAVATLSGQGTLYFSNFGTTLAGGTLDEPIYQADGSTPLDSTYEVGLYIGQFETGLFSLVPGSVTLISGNGLFNGGIITFPGAPPDTLVEFTVAAWKASEGNTLEAALAANPVSYWGVSHFGGIGLGGGTLPPADLSRFGSFNLIGPVPEPESAILFGLSFLALMARSRFKRT